MGTGKKLTAMDVVDIAIANNKLQRKALIDKKEAYNLEYNREYNKISEQLDRLMEFREEEAANIG